MLSEAGIENQYVYLQVQVGDAVEDHAVNLVQLENEAWIVDAYNVRFNGLKFRDLTRAEGFNPNRDQIAPIADSKNVQDLGRAFRLYPELNRTRILKVNSYPRFAVPKSP